MPKTKVDRNLIYAKAIRQLGAQSQIDIAIEEMAELTKELLKQRRYGGNYFNILNELADVEVCCEQLRMIYSCSEALELRKDSVALRLEERLESGELNRYIDRHRDDEDLIQHVGYDDAQCGREK